MDGQKDQGTNSNYLLSVRLHRFHHVRREARPGLDWPRTKPSSH
jgi:hypothetical protein